MSSEKISSAFKKRLVDHESLTSTCKVMLSRILAENNVDVLSVSGRTKNISSVLEKIRRKRYSSPEIQMTDLTGVRVIVFFESQVSIVSELIRKVFDVDEDNSVDRDTILGDDRIGYRSVHFVCSLGRARSRLSEYKNIHNLKFEIQVRTVLQHAWAELAHDRAYKFSSELPGNLQRKLNLYSGMLEVVDRGFDEVSNEIDQYASTVEATHLTLIKNHKIDSINIQKVVDEIEDKYSMEFAEMPIDRSFVDELEAFGVSKVGDLIDLISDDFISDFKVSRGEKSTNIGIIRSAMMYKDFEKYFVDAWGVSRWSAITHNGVEMLRKKYGDSVVDRLEGLNIAVWGSDEDELWAEFE